MQSVCGRNCYSECLEERLFMKKILAIMLLVVTMCSVTGCNEDKERIDKAATQALEAQDEAREVVNEMNEDTMNLENQAQELEAE